MDPKTNFVSLLNVLNLGSIPESKPFAPNEILSTDEPINVAHYLEQKASQMQTSTQRMFGDETKTNVLWYGPGTYEIFNSDHQTFLWQWRSNGTMTCGQETIALPVKSCLIVPKNVRMSLVNNKSDCVTLSVAMPLPV